MTECTARFVTVSMEAAGLTWEAEVGFADWVPPDFGLLGQASFFRYFIVTFCAADLDFEVEPIEF